MRVRYNAFNPLIRSIKYQKSPIVPKKNQVLCAQCRSPSVPLPHHGGPIYHNIAMDNPCRGLPLDIRFSCCDFSSRPHRKRYFLTDWEKFGSTSLLHESECSSSYNCFRSLCGGPRLNLGPCSPPESLRGRGLTGSYPPNRTHSSPPTTTKLSPSFTQFP